jgi:hypothetical protein
MTSDGIIPFNDVQVALQSRHLRSWQLHFAYLLQREPALRLFVISQRAAMEDYLKQQGVTAEQLEKIDGLMMSMTAVSVSLLERAHRRLWEGMLPDVTTEMRATT